MRNNIVSSGADELSYEIREIVAIGQKLATLGVPISWENIGDPVAKGHTLPAWIKEIVVQTITEDETAFGYSPTKGVLETRKFIAEIRNKEGGVQITADDILFFNGLGDAISKLYTNLNVNARVIGPDPAYPTHSSAEAAHARSSHLTYKLDPKNHWLPDLEDLRNKVKYNPTISGILIINPDNPTGMVYPKNILEGIVAIAKEFNLFIISDEIYANIFYHADSITLLSSVIGDVPGIAMRGLSKEIPWPGGRCGWIEFYNTEKDPVFARYAKSLVDAKMLEVCSTTLPQKVLPKVYKDSRYAEYLKEKSAFYKKRADTAYDILSKVPNILVTKPSGAFYLSVVFKDSVLKNNQTLPIAKPDIKKYLESITQNIRSDKRFVYYLLASTGICVVPLSGFNSTLPGFRITLLEIDDTKFATVFETVAKSITEYLNS